MVEGSCFIFTPTLRHVRIVAITLVMSVSGWAQANEATETVLDAAESKKQLGPQNEESGALKKLPKYELGVGGGVFYVPDYPGADESRSRSLGLPYFIYRGDVWRADREGGIRGRFINRDKLKFDLSFNAGFNSNSEDNDARNGMYDLDWIGEVGPRVVYQAVRNKTHSFDLSLPIRHVFTVGVKSWDYQHRARGFTINPEIKYGYRGLFGPTSIVRLTLGGTWATEKLMDYFYEVEPVYVTADRPQFDAKPGYMSTDLSLSVVHFFPKQNVAFFVGTNWSFYNDAENRMSPLLRDRDTASYAAGFVWSMLQSKELASGE